MNRNGRPPLPDHLRRERHLQVPVNTHELSRLDAVMAHYGSKAIALFVRRLIDDAHAQIPAGAQGVRPRTAAATRVHLGSAVKFRPDAEARCAALEARLTDAQGRCRRLLSALDGSISLKADAPKPVK